MGKVEVKVVFETITPLWTGDAWQENSEIRPSSLMGSLRMAFSKYCEEKGIDNCRGMLNEKGVVDEKFKNKKLKKYITSFDIKKILEKEKVSLESQLFGCQGWKSRITIKSINAKKKKYLESITFIVDKLYEEEFNSFIKYLIEAKQEIYIGKGQKKQKGGKVKIIRIEKVEKLINEKKRIKKMKIWKN